MNDMKERLIELMKEWGTENTDSFPFESVADHLIENGVIVLPCKAGDTVFDIRWWDDKEEKIKVDGKYYYRTIHKHKVSKAKFSLYDFDEIGKTVFLTKEEAEQALKEREQ